MSSYKRVKGRSHTVEKRKASHPQKPHATSQPSRFSHTPRLSRLRPCELPCSCLRGVSRWFTPLACGPGSPELSKSYMDMASKLFTFTFTFI